ncbi:signal transduction histidine kinase [Breznakia blatticola]|uniref:histidine kinase n=1 Tax=Breznakia blatticola TaxID=1754012 RepID=A0A4R8A3G6_9FIRM|nr:sensor histidine kinase [Breznakia blatticola]TDW25119.1 signal transduction histidine kinase [Breznakia blatticola]
MKRNYFTSLSTIRNIMTILNFIIVLFYASTYLLGTKYIVDNQMAREFLDRITYIPKNPVFLYFGSLLLYFVLIGFMYTRTYHKKQKKNHALYNIALVGVSFSLIYMLNMGYNGILFLVFCDSIYHMKDKFSRGLLVSLIIIFLFTNYDISSVFLKMSSPSAYFAIYEANVRSVLMILKNVMETFNLLLFISFIIVYIANQIQENERIAHELDMIHQVNRELTNYSLAIEKVGENNERKRLAREIHDTLGHALTGIAAGIDACIAMIDINTEQTKKQLHIVSKVVRQGIGDVRNSLNKLRPGALEHQNLKGAIEQMIEEVTGVSHLQVDLHYNLENIDFEKAKEDVLFRIIQESITNAMRHGGATKIDIHLYQKENFVYMEMQDNGVGCKEIKYGFGLRQMMERVVIIGGEIHFDGANGFLTIVKIPIQKGEHYD